MWSKGMANTSSLRGEVIGEDGDGDELSWEEKEKVLKAPKRASKMLVSVVAPAVGMGIILLGWVMFGLGVSWVRYFSFFHEGVEVIADSDYTGRTRFCHRWYSRRVRW